MIWIFNLERASAGLCDNYTDAFQYIREMESLKQDENFKKSHTDFEINSSSNEAEVKQWCIDYCQHNGYALIETPSQSVNTESAHWNSNNTSPYSENRLKHAS